jgi:methylmalonyl-CoA carboxyltransferase large subunit
MSRIDSGAGDLKAVIEDIRGQLALLTDRVLQLEASSGGVVGGDQSEAVSAAAAAEAAPLHAAAVAPSGAPGPPAPIAEAISEELLVVISAAVAAFLGERAHIRQIRLLSSSLWAIQGRASVQASHRLNR